MKTRRRIIQLLLFISFLYIFIKTTYPLNGYTFNYFMRISPLNALYTNTAAAFGYFLPVILLILFTLLLGRFFCGWICPMGTTLDLGEKLTGSGMNDGKTKKLGWIKYFILAFVITASFFGVSKTYLLEPMSLSYRFYTFTVFPVIDAGWKYLKETLPFLSGVQFNTSFVDISYRLGVIYFFLFLGILLLSRIYKRFWCRNVCPLGALLSIFARFSLLQKIVNEKCTHCGLCTKKCKMGAIPEDPAGFAVTECIYCFDCVSICPVKAVSFSPQKPQNLENIINDSKNFLMKKKPSSAETASGFSRRMLFEAVGLGAAAAVIVKTEHNREYRYGRLIRPPGALPEEEFYTACIRCGECMKVCITGGLQPCLFESGLSGFMTPRLIPQVGFCQDRCTMCGETCPTGAIQPFEFKDKPHMRIGLANINRSTCLVWAHDEHCLVCDEYCPYQAIYWNEYDERMRPLVDKTKCIGCGTCENKCPIKPEAAIRVYRQGENRVKLPEGASWQSVDTMRNSGES